MLRGAGQPVGDRSADLRLLHPAEAERPVEGRVGAVRRRVREDDRRRLPPAVEHELPRQPVDRNRRLQVSQRRPRQDRHLQHGGAPAGQDRGLRRLEEGRDREDLREAEGSQRRNPPRHVHRSQPGPQGRRDRPRHAAGKGVPVRQRHPRDRRDVGRAEAHSLDVQAGGGPQRQDPARRFHRQQGDRRRQAEAPDERKQGARALGSDSFPDRVHGHDLGPRHLLRAEVRRGCRARRRLLPRSRLPARERRRAGAQGHRGFRRQENAVGRAADSRHRRTALQGRRVRRGRQHGGEDRFPQAALQAQNRRVLRRKAHPEGPRESARSVRHRRVLRVHGIPRLQVPRRPQPERARGAGGAARRGVGEGAAGSGRRRRDDADAGRAAVLRQPHHVRRQHHDPRQRHSARDAAGRGRRLQHRGAEVQRQAVEPAGLLQGARRQARRSGRAEDGELRRTRSTSSSSSRNRTATRSPSAPASPSSKASSGSCRSRRPTSSAAAKA